MQNQQAGLGEVVANAIEEAQKGTIPHIYANGFTNALGSGDIVVVLQRNGPPAAVLNLSFTAAKSLSQKLNELIANLEALTGNTIMTTDDINNSLEKSRK
ncbi:MAG: hypothetical protein HUU46_14585 [Candidatus Hydrogenedentes bacterium]|nr:hypothetical protein [Candidatus Hydrogenedentota bacterium]